MARSNALCRAEVQLVVRARADLDTPGSKQAGDAHLLQCAAIGALSPGEAWEGVSLSPAFQIRAGGGGGFSLQVSVAF